MKRLLYVLPLLISIAVLIGVGMIYLRIIDMQTAGVKEEELLGRISMERMYIKDNITEAVMSDGIVVDSLDVCSDRPMLVCYYSSQSCGSCVNYAIEQIDEFFPDSKYGKESPVLFLVSGFDEKALFKEKNTINIGKRKLGLGIDEAMFVCYFVLNKGIAYHLFIPSKEYPEYTTTYFENVKRRYFKDS